MVVGLIEAY